MELLYLWIIWATIGLLCFCRLRAVPTPRLHRLRRHEIVNATAATITSDRVAPDLDSRPERTKPGFVMSELTSLDVTLLHEQNLEKVLSTLPKLNDNLTWTFWLNYKQPMSIVGSSTMGCEKPKEMPHSAVQTPSRSFASLPPMVLLANFTTATRFYAAIQAFQPSPCSIHTLEIPFNMLLGDRKGAVFLADVLPGNN
ncbi:hypothetical protein MBM_07301 [Drepanopeziza brunnea f. sp. 'multigermtubi' MB_m1]|uniref:Uncharacterized protein n=1 Tax=Marssonina brunnea f. sp. multigermtubi (strain MB_m1) TaxID=1072389 RepID=K1WB88_MARBU|nr:uncharacterized protein MBM_07301 [Drepanopeziza brunnea f. sp. 'multigermtubi' MB_m1]EKD14580.1 hypothetical protein MBM_07301 [Drepanopeziza brunnea f. sp. 'multigermtubi' MB_m1]